MVEIPACVRKIGCRIQPRTNGALQPLLNNKEIIRRDIQRRARSQKTFVVLVQCVIPPVVRHNEPESSSCSGSWERPCRYQGGSKSSCGDADLFVVDVMRRSILHGLDLRLEKHQGQSIPFLLGQIQHRFSFTSIPKLDPIEPWPSDTFSRTIAKIPLTRDSIQLGGLGDHVPTARFVHTPDGLGTSSLHACAAFAFVH